MAEIIGEDIFLATCLGPSHGAILLPGGPYVDLGLLQEPWPLSYGSPQSYRRHPICPI